MKVVIWRPNSPIRQALQNTSVQPGHESRAFEFYCTVIAVHISGHFAFDFWTRVLPQVAERHDSVRTAMVALGYISRSFHGASSPETTTEVQKQGYFQYGKTLAALQQLVNQPTAPFELILLINLVLIGCEVVRGDFEAALRQINSGAWLFLTWLTKGGATDNTTTAEVSKHLLKHYHELMVQSVMFVDTSVLNPAIFEKMFRIHVPALPILFSSINEAKYLLDHCVIACIHRSLSNLASGKPLTTPHNGLVQYWPSPIYGLTDSAIFAPWRETFENSLAAWSHNGYDVDEQAVINLRMHYLAFRIIGVAGVACPETIFDQFEVDFESIVHIGKLYAQMSPHRFGHNLPRFDMGIIPPLYLTASRCRNPRIRRAALLLLRSSTGREGIWDGRLMALLAERIMVLEEQGLGNVKQAADIPPEMRITVTNATILVGQRRIVVKICQRARSSRPECNVTEYIEF